jgi:PKD repeat protein
MALVNLRNPTISSRALLNLIKNQQRAKPIQSWAIFLVIVTLFICTIQPVQAADPYGSAKTAYIASHPGQTIIPYPWEPTSSVKILPLNFIVPAAPGNSILIQACPDQFESASFIITAQTQLTGITILSSALSDGNGHTIPEGAIDVRLVKVWYQRDTFETTNNVILTPELLLKNDSLVRVNYNSKQNEIWVKNRTYEGYIPVAYITQVSDYTIFDTATSSGGVQPFSLLQSENKQIWMTAHVPANAVAGNYTGTISLSSPASTPVIMNFVVRVLPFTLEPAPLKEILYYNGRVADTWRATKIGDDWRTPQRYALELQDMKDHGVSYPQFSQDDLEPGMLNTALSLRSQSGLPKDRIYLNWNAYIGNATDSAGLVKVADLVKKWKTYTSAYGFTDVYFHGMDEVRGNLVLSQRSAWTTVHNNGGRMVTTSFDTTDPVDLTGNILDAVNLGTRLNATAASVMHDYGHEIYLYNQPQVGIENPENYRKNYGFALWNGGYDGVMDFAYQARNGDSIWNDFDSPTKDEVFAYPTTNGVIDTIEWEGFREGVDDTRFAATLKKKEGSDISGKEIVSSLLAQGNGMPAIRQKIIDRLLLSKPAASFSGTPLTGTAPLKVQFTDGSSNSPTSWNWTFGDGSLLNTTTKNPIHTYTKAGTYTVSLNVTNSLGSTIATRVNYITVIGIPEADFTGISTSGTSPLVVTFSDTSTNSPTSWDWTFGDGSIVNSTSENPIHMYTAAGNYTVTLKATNGAGSNIITRVDYIRVSEPPVVPVPNKTVTPEPTPVPTPIPTPVGGTNPPGTPVNQPPELAVITPKVVDKGSTLTFVVGASDPDGDITYYSATNLPKKATFDKETRTFSWSPDNSQSGIYYVGFSVTDGSLTDTQTVTITVNNPGGNSKSSKRSYYIKLE